LPCNHKLVGPTTTVGVCHEKIHWIRDFGVTCTGLCYGSIAPVPGISYKPLEQAVGHETLSKDEQALGWAQYPYPKLKSEEQVDHETLSMGAPPPWWGEYIADCSGKNSIDDPHEVSMSVQEGAPPLAVLW